MEIFMHTHIHKQTQTQTVSFVQLTVLDIVKISASINTIYLAAPTTIIHPKALNYTMMDTLTEQPLHTHTATQAIIYSSFQLFIPTYYIFPHLLCSQSQWFDAGNWWTEVQT